MKKISFVIITILCVCSTIGWIYPEHRQIALIAIQKLSDENRDFLQSLWTEARKGYENRLTENIIYPQQSIDPGKLDYAAWPAIAGDHSCSPEEMLNNVLETDWILDVADIAARLKIDLADNYSPYEHINTLRHSDLELQETDPEYATRAGSNNVHFLAALIDIDTDLESYLRHCNSDTTEINAIGVYTKYHFSALRKISHINDSSFINEQISKIILAALADEAFALHFLEDIFAAGHVAGTWGDASQRKGTHDFYNRKGLKTNTWNGENIIITGDAYMRQEDAERAATVIKISLEELILAAKGNLKFKNDIVDNSLFRPDTFNSCKALYLPKNNIYDYDNSLLEKIIFERTPVPGLASGIGELPRFRAELGLFAGFAPSLRGSFVSGGFTTEQNVGGIVGGIETALRVGVGLDGVLNESGDGLTFLEVGWRQDGSSTIGTVDADEIRNFGAILSAVPARSAFSVRLRSPFYLIPGDLLIAGPLLYLISPESLTNMGVDAVNGGLVPWQAGIATAIGKFQFILGREVAVYFFGRGKFKDAIIAPYTDNTGDVKVQFVNYKSTQIEFPILEYTPLRSFAFDQSSTLHFQLYGGVDIISNPGVIDIEEPEYPIEYENVWYLGIKLTFDWRYYF